MAEWRPTRSIWYRLNEAGIPPLLLVCVIIPAGRNGASGRSFFRATVLAEEAALGAGYVGTRPDRVQWCTRSFLRGAVALFGGDRDTKQVRHTSKSGQNGVDIDVSRLLGQLEGIDLGEGRPHRFERSPDAIDKPSFASPSL